MLARLELRRVAGERLSLAIPLKVRLLPALVSGWLLYALAGFGPAPVSGPRTFALVLCAISAAAALYDDRWTFDLPKKKVTRRLGLLFAARETSIDMESLERVVVTGRVVYGEDAGQRRAARGSHAALALEEREGRRIPLESTRGPRAGELRAVASEIAAFCGLTLEDRTA